MTKLSSENFEKWKKFSLFFFSVWGKHKKKFFPAAALTHFQELKKYWKLAFLIQDVHYLPPHTHTTQAFGGSRKNGLFFTFLNSFHFYPKIKENKNFFCKKKTQKNAQKIAIFSFSRRCFIFKFFIFYITCQLEKIKKKLKKISKKSKKKSNCFCFFFRKIYKNFVFLSLFWDILSFFFIFSSWHMMSKMKNLKMKHLVEKLKIAVFFYNKNFYFCWPSGKSEKI